MKSVLVVGRHMSLRCSQEQHIYIYIYITIQAINRASPYMALMLDIVCSRCSRTWHIWKYIWRSIFGPVQDMGQWRSRHIKELYIYIYIYIYMCVCVCVCVCVYKNQTTAVGRQWSTQGQNVNCKDDEAKVEG